jgi:lipoprotein-releasing system ATP-binding protein
MDIVGLTKVKNNLAINLSGGQQQRVAIARSLINNPKIILADEPTGNLDSDTTEQVYELLRSINQRYQTTFIIITHDRHIAEKADRIIEIKDGRIHLDISKSL